MIQHIKWDGKQITEPGIYSDIPIEIYHNDPKLLDGPSVSKSSIKHLAPPYGSPKEFWWNYAGNPERLAKPYKKVFEFGHAVHMLLLGEGTFYENFVVRPETVGGKNYNARTKEWVEWFADVRDAGYMVITKEEIEQIKRMADDAQSYHMVKNGILNGHIERSMFWKCPVTGIWLKSRPDVIPTDSGLYADVKTVGKFDREFLRRQWSDMGYYIQGGMIQKICRGLGLPFQGFTLLYTSTEDIPNTAHADAVQEDLDFAEQIIDISLRKIRRGLDKADWPGPVLFSPGSEEIRMNSWAKTQIEKFIQESEL